MFEGSFLGVRFAIFRFLWERGIAGRPRNQVPRSIGGVSYPRKRAVEREYACKGEVEPQAKRYNCMHTFERESYNWGFQNYKVSHFILAGSEWTQPVAEIICIILIFLLLHFFMLLLWLRCWIQFQCSKAEMFCLDKCRFIQNFCFYLNKSS